MSAGSISLEQVAAHMAVLAVACSRCDRAGRYPVDALIARHGPGFGVPEVLTLLSGTAQNANLSAETRCNIGGHERRGCWGFGKGGVPCVPDFEVSRMAATSRTTAASWNGLRTKAT